MFNETYLTLVGNVVGTPSLRLTKNGHAVANFRVASTPRRFDRDANKWVDGDTLFVTVTCWRALAENAAQSLKKGQPVVVHGRYYQRNYVTEETARTAYELDAISVGHDLSRGTSVYSRAERQVPGAVRLDADGNPADESEHYIDAAEAFAAAGEADETEASIAEDDRIVAEIDMATGEVRDLVSAG